MKQAPKNAINNLKSAWLSVNARLDRRRNNIAGRAILKANFERTVLAVLLNPNQRDNANPKKMSRKSGELFPNWSKNWVNKVCSMGEVLIIFFHLTPTAFSRAYSPGFFLTISIIRFFLFLTIVLSCINLLTFFSCRNDPISFVWFVRKRNISSSEFTFIYS